MTQLEAMKAATPPKMKNETGKASVNCWPNAWADAANGVAMSARSETTRALAFLMRLRLNVYFAEVGLASFHFKGEPAALIRNERERSGRASGEIDLLVVSMQMELVAFVGSDGYGNGVPLLDRKDRLARNKRARLNHEHKCLCLALRCASSWRRNSTGMQIIRAARNHEHGYEREHAISGGLVHRGNFSTMRALIADVRPRKHPDWPHFLDHVNALAALLQQPEYEQLKSDLRTLHDRLRSREVLQEAAGP